MDVEKAPTAATEMEQYRKRGGKLKDHNTYDLNWAAAQELKTVDGPLRLRQKYKCECL